MPARRGQERYDSDRYDGDRYEGDQYNGYDESPAYRRRRPWYHWAAGAVAIAALGSGSAAVAGVIAPDPTAAYQAGLDYGDPAPVLHGLDGGAVPNWNGLQAALFPYVGAAGLGPDPGISVADAASGTVLWDVRGDAVMTPASSAKLLTAAAVLATRGPNYRIPTRAVAGANPGDVVLVAGGDPTLAINGTSAYRGAARLDELAAQVRAALGGVAPTRVVIDESIFQGAAAVHPDWGSADVGTIVSPITALMNDGARVNPADQAEYPRRQAEPDLATARAFAQLLGLQAFQVVPSGRAPDGARVLGEVLSPPIVTMVEEMLATSDNTVAEMMARQVAVARGVTPSFGGAAQAIRDVLVELGVPPTSLVDGSGLARANGATPNQLVAVLHLAASPEHPELRSLISGLAVAGYSGTLDDRHNRGDAGRGVVRAKTGTLRGVNALVGYVIDADGRLLAFAVIGNGTSNESAAEQALDNIARALSQCGCR